MKKTSLKKLGIILTLVAISNMIIAGEVFALQQVAININSGSLSFKPPTSITFKKTMLRAGQPTIATAVLDPADPDQNLQVIDQAVGTTFNIDVSMQNFQKTAAKYLVSGINPPETILTLNDISNIQDNSFVIIGDEYMKVVSVNIGANAIQVERGQLGTTANTYNADAPVNLGGNYIANLTQPVAGTNETTFHVSDISEYDVGKTLIATTPHNSGYEHLKVVSVQKTDTITVERGAEDTLGFMGSYTVDDGFIVMPDIVGYDQLKILTFTENPSESVDIGTSNNPIATNNVTAPLDYKEAAGLPQSEIIANPDAIADVHFTSFPISSADGNHHDAGSESEPITLIQRHVAIPDSIGTYAVGMVLRITLPPETKYGNYISQLTFTKNPYP